MKNVFILFCLYAGVGFAQVGIGTTNPNASLDIRSSNEVTPANTDGLLIPKVEEFPAINPTVLQDSMLVFATGAGSVAKGYYSWDNASTSWVLFSGAKEINDLNDGITNGNNSSIFLGVDSGTNDDGTTNANVGLGYRSLRDNITGGANTAVGNGALRNNVSGGSNTAMGFGVLASNTSGGFNTAIGLSAMQNHVDGINNVSLGAYALSTTNGSSNTAIGFRSLRFNVAGNNNIAIGSYSGNNVDGNANILIGNNAGDSSVLRAIHNNIFIGNNSGTGETNSDRLYIENSNADSNNALIYGEFDNDILRTNGTFQIGNPAGTGYALPSVDGTSNQILQTDGAGAMSWVNPSATVIHDINDLVDGKSDNDGTNDGSSIFLGLQAGANDDSSDNQNIGIGFQSLNNNLTGSFNIALGFASLGGNTSGNFNTALGTYTGSSSFVGNNNTYIGYSAGRFNTDGNNNVYLGNEAGGGISSPPNRDGGVYIGYQAGLNSIASNRLYIENSSSTSPLIYGEFANNILRANAEFQIGNPAGTGYAFPTIDGTASQVLQTDGAGAMTWVDPSATVTHQINDLVDGRSDNDGTNDGSSIFLGVDAGMNDDGTDNANVGIGYQVLQVNSTGAYNVASGYRALFSNISGDRNVANGAAALYNNTTGNDNTASGNSALASNTFGIENSAFGTDTLLANDEGNGNTAMGYQASLHNINGNLNTASGSNALHWNLIGNNNAAFGAYSLHQTSGNNNTAIGVSSGRSVSGDNNVFLGYQAGRGASALVKHGSIHIGYQAGYNELNNNRLYIENSNSTSPLIYGEFDNDIVGINGSLGVGTQAPGAPLHINEEGTSGVQTIVAAIGSDTSNRPVLQFSETANVGLADGMSLEYDGRGSGNANRMVFNSVGGNPLFEFRNGGDLTLRDGDLIVRGTATDREIRLEDDAGNPDRALMRQTGTQDIYVGDIDNNGGDTYVRAGGSTELSVIAGTGFVGVNTTAPAFTFEVNGNAAKPGGGSWLNASDKRLKKNISPYTEGLETILKIEPVSYQYNSLSGFDEDSSYVGVIAQDLQKIDPSMVTTYTRENQEYLAVDNSAMTYMLINAVKTQQVEIEQLKNELQEIKAMLIQKSND